MTMNITLRPATTEDVELYAHIARNASSQFNHTVADPKKVLTELTGSKVFFIQRDGADLGFISYTTEVTGQAYISEVAVLPNFRGQGIGGAAIRSLLEDLRGLGFTSFSLVTHPQNPARRLYERLGFRVTGEEIQDYLGTGTPRVTLEMTE